VTDLGRAKAWYSTAFQHQPYFDEPFYVGFNIGLIENPHFKLPAQGVAT